MTDTRDELFTPDRAVQVAWIVYINGIEVPAADASVSYGVWQTPQAEVVLVPDPILQRLGAEDRVSVQIFYCDYWIDPENPEFRLMFDGEIVSWSYVNVSTGRAISFTCVDYIHIWDQLFFFFMTSLDSMATAASGSAIGVNATTVLNTAFAPIYPYSLFAYGLIPRSSEAAADGSSAGTQLITRPIDFVYNVVRGLIDTSLPNRTAIGSNFFSPWTQRTNFHKRFVALPLLEDSANPGVFPILRAVQADNAINAVARIASHTGNAGSVWQMLREVLQPLMMEVSMLPTAPALRSDYNTLNINGPAPSETTPTSPVFIANYFTKPSFYFGLPPSCNVFFPSQISTFGYQEDYLTQPTRMYFNDETLPTLLESNATGTGTALSQLLRDAISVAHPLEVNIAARAAMSASGISGKDILVYPEEFFKGPVIDRRAFPSWFAYIANSTVQDAPEENPVPTVNGVPVSIAPPPEGSTGTPTSTTATTSPIMSTAAEEDAGFTPVDANESVDPNYVASAGAAVTSTTSAPAVSSVSSSSSSAGSTTSAASAPAATPPPARSETTSTGPGPSYSSVSSAPADVALAARAGIPVLMMEAIRNVESRGNPSALAFNRRIFLRRQTRRPPYDIPSNLYTTRDPYYPQGIGGREAFRAAYALDALAAVKAVAWGQYQILGGFILGAYGNNPAALLAAFEADPVSFSANSLVAWFNNAGRGNQACKRAANAYDYDNTARYYFGASNPTYGERLRTFVERRRAGATVAEASGSRHAASRRGSARTATPTTVVEPTATAPVADTNINIVTDVATVTDPAELNREILRYYAQYEFYKERYSRRTGSLTMAFNPYPVPGFPCAVFDRRSTQVDVFGYLMSVNQILRSNGWETRLSFTQGRTFQEMFSLLRQQFIFENAQLNANVTEGNVEGSTSTGFAGALGIAPPEPLREIRDIIQSFSRAQTFYRTLFFCAPVRATDTAPTATAPEPISSESATPEGAAATAPAPMSTPAAAATTPSVSSPDVAAKLAFAEKQTVFYYTEIVELYDPSTGVRTPIQISGVDSTTRTGALQAIERLRTKSSPATSDVDIQFVTRVALTSQDAGDDAISRTQTLLRTEYDASTPGTPSASFNVLLDNLRFSIQNLPVDFNIRGDLDIVPKLEAIPLFESYEQATRYNARPICSLEEYITFLGDRGVRVAPIEPNSDTDGARLFPVKYYVQIKQYRDGPPPIVPTTNITNTELVTSPSGSDAVSSGTENAVVQGLPADFPETRSNWTDILLQYRQRVLTELPPRS